MWSLRPQVPWGPFGSRPKAWAGKERPPWREEEVVEEESAKRERFSGTPTDLTGGLGEGGGSQSLI